MALLIKDGMDYGFYNSFYGRLMKWDFTYESAGSQIITVHNTLGRFGGGCMFTFGNANLTAGLAHRLKVPLPNTDTLFIGYSWYASEIKAVASNQTVAVAVSSQGLGATGDFNKAHVFIRTKIAAGLAQKWEVCVGDSSTSTPIVLGEYALVADLGIVTAQWHWLEWEIKVHATTGFVKLRVDGVLKINLTGVNTANNDQPATVDWAALMVCDTAATFGSQLWDDIHIWDNRGTGMIAASTGKGKYIATLRPTANGASNPGTPSAGSAFQCVDETFGGSVIDSADDYVLSLPGQTELFAVADGPGYAGIEDVTVTVVHRGTGAGLGNVKPVARLGSTNYEGDTFPVYAESLFRAAEHHFALNPATAAAWAAADIPAMQAGYEVQT